MEKELTRCFIALDPPREVINEIKKSQRLIRGKKLFDGKLIESENLHLTLKFLREIDDETIEKIRERLREIEFDDFEVHLGNIGIFSKKRIRIIWVELLGKGIFDLQKQIDEKLSDLFDEENRFMSHITIARVKRVYDKKGFLEYLKTLKISKIRFRIDKFFFKKSELFETGPVYEDIEEYELNKILNT